MTRAQFPSRSHRHLSKVEPGHSATVIAQFCLKYDFDRSLVPLYSEFIGIHSSGDERKYQVPFAGVAYDVTTLPIFDKSNGLPAFARLSDASPTITNVITDDGAVFTLNAAVDDLPAVDISFFMGTRVLRLELLPSDPSVTGTTLFAGLHILCNAHGFPITSGLPRSTSQVPFQPYVFNGTLSSGATVPNGKYRLAARALKLLAGNEDGPDSWDTFLQNSKSENSILDSLQGDRRASCEVKVGISAFTLQYLLFLS